MDNNLSWDSVTQDTQNNPIVIGEYVVYETTSGTPVLLAPNTTGATTVTIPNVTPGTHRYRIAARRVLGDPNTEGAMSNEAVILNPIPKAPTNAQGTLS